MFRVFFILFFILQAQFVSAQDGDFSDEFDVSEPAFELNDPSLTVGPSEGSSEDIEIPKTFEESVTPAPQAEPDVVEVPQENLFEEPWESEKTESVIVRERVPVEELSPSTDHGLVEVRSVNDIFLPYKKRQRPWGFMISAGAELVSFPSLLSQYDDPGGGATSFEDIFGSQGNSMLSLELGPKYNTAMGSLGLYVGYGSMQTEGKHNGYKAELDISRYSATLVYFLDNLWSEPYFVPYVGAGAWQAEYLETSEDTPGTKIQYSTDIGYHYRLGALINLDWIEPSTALLSRRKLGLQATFLNLYATTSYMSESDPDPNLENEMDFGASLVLEF